ncbi:MAG: DUF4112 domain-containing protein [Gomphosphaeria aponina SAG 52.96 = DSM 107014]|uniref:DUF4112 domain-containing protein n=1 Tax=Gomphosphaeria aponina SAG 52.96 = DSM 107014 TaxID=1521640 RepID=A0A941GRX1_9CHRO|nr:DUF4112 domain-containing protein [Gomphosphaeria aponina SAG 52.96 = DSM 107014]
MNEEAIKKKSLEKNSKESQVEKLRSLTNLLDNAIAIPGTRYRLGIDPLLGLFPAAGDYITAGLSAYIVVEAAKIGVPKKTLFRMVLNIVFDALAGTVPLLGDLFDATWKANVKNMALLDSYLDSTVMREKADWWFIALLLGGLLLVVISVSVVSLSILAFLFRAING